MGRKDRAKYEIVQNEEENDSELAEGSDLEAQIDISPILVSIKLPDDKVLELEIFQDTTIIELMQKIQEKEEIEPNRQRLVHFGKMLNQRDPNSKVSDAGVKNGDFVHLMPLPKNVSQASNVAPGMNQQIPTAQFAPQFGFIDLPAEIDLSSADYFQRVQLGLWRSRVRLISSLLLFYYFLQTAGNISIWLHPEELSTQYEDNYYPSNMFFMIDLLEGMIGISAAFAGMKAAASVNPTFAVLFLRNTIELCVTHFIAFAVYYNEVLSGTIRLKRRFDFDNEHSANALEDKEALIASVMFAFLLNVSIWITIMSISARFYYSLSALYRNMGENRETEVYGEVEEEEV